MKTITRTYYLLATLALLSGEILAQVSTDLSPAVPTSNPEPLTLLAAAGGAIFAGGLALRLRKKKH